MELFDFFQTAKLWTQKSISTQPYCEEASELLSLLEIQKKPKVTTHDYELIISFTFLIPVSSFILHACLQIPDM
jgi:hypothetical protein